MATAAAEASVAALDAAGLDAALDGALISAAPTGREAGAGRLTAEWVSGACSGRAYKRTLVLSANHAFVAQDVVHPCAGECVVQWVLKREGTWAASANGDAVSLVVKSLDGPPRERADAKALPDRLTVDAASGTLREPSGDCVYRAEL